VYALVDPRTLLVRYIGQSSTGMDRPREHACPSRLKRRTHKSAWIKSLAKVGLRYVIAVLETVDSIDRLNDCETWWMMFGRALGWDLTNHAPAGGSVRGLVRSVETRAKISVALQGRKLSLEHRAAISRGNMGRVISKYTREMTAESNRLRAWTTEAKDKLRQANSRYRHTPEALAKIAEAGRGRKYGPKSAEVKEKLSKALKGKPLPEVTIARMSIARRKPPRLLINLMPGRRR